MASIFASRTTSDPIPLPGTDPPQTVTVRTLTGGELDHAQGVHLRATIGGRWAAHGWAAVFQRQLAAGTATAADAQRLLEDPLNGYDRHALVHAGLMAWSFADPALPAQVSDADTSAEAIAARAARVKVIADLTDAPLEFLAREILRRSKPGLFLTVDEAEAKKKSASDGSTLH